MPAVLDSAAGQGGRRPRAVVSPPRRRLVAAAYQRLRKAHGDPWLRLALAETLLDTPRLDLVMRHLRRIGREMPVDWPGLARVGEVLFRLGEFESARRALMAALDAGHADADGLRTLSAVCYRLGARRAARRHLATSAWLRPISRDHGAGADRPEVLRTRSFDGSFYAVRRRKGSRVWSRWLKNGHFSLKHLLPRADMTMHVANIFRDNLELVDDLPKVDMVINLVACPDLMEDSLQRVQGLVTRYPEIPVINPPDRVLRTTRAENAVRLGALPDVRFPRTERVEVQGDPDAMLTRIEALDLGYPLILREAGTQTGDTLEKCDDRAAALAYLDGVEQGVWLNAIQYIDCRGEDGFFHKTRCFFIDGQFYQVANLTNDDWQIHSGDRYRVMSSNPASQEAERAYLTDPRGYLGDRAWDALHAISAKVRLDFFGIDFTPDPEGGVIVFEANAAMRHNFDHAKTFPYTRPYLERVTHAFEAMLADRLGIARPEPATRAVRAAQRTVSVSLQPAGSQRR